MTYSKAAIAVAVALFSAPSAVVSQDTACLNDMDYLYNDSGLLRRCSNIRLQETRRQTLCQITEVREACPQTCGICCDDDPTFTFPLDNVDVDQNCSWIIKNNVETRRANYCTIQDFIVGAGTTIRNMCPKACDFCQELVVVGPTASPTKAPTASPTKAPTGAPTASPTKAPTGGPTASPTKSPTKAPTTSPTKAPIAPTASPTKAPIAPTASPTKAPIAPTASPTKAPTASPTTAAPTPPCTDDASFTWTLPNAGTTADCNWLTKNISKQIIRKQTYCNDAEIKYACPVTCGACGSCMDSATFQFELMNIPGEMRGCSWLTQNPTKSEIRKGNYCDTIGASCPSSCGFC